ncbi:MAG: hypothetical protein ACLQIB_34510 [Isosphaeraceae bacterium]
MALSTTLRTRAALRRIAAALRDFANEQGWQRDEYQVLFRILEDWGRITILLVAKDLGGVSDTEMRARVWNYLGNALKQGGDIGFSIGLLVRTWDEVNKGPAHSIPEGYVEEEILLGSGAGE